MGELPPAAIPSWAAMAHVAGTLSLVAGAGTHIPGLLSVAGVGTCAVV